LQKMRGVSEAISRGETPSFGLSVALNNPPVDQKTARKNLLVLQDAEDMRTQDEWEDAFNVVTWEKKKRGWPLAALVLFQYTPYIEGEDFELAEEALEAMTCILLDNMFEGFEGQVGKHMKGLRGRLASRLGTQFSGAVPTHGSRIRHSPPRPSLNSAVTYLPTNLSLTVTE